MTVVSSTQSVVQPGRWEDAAAIALEASKLLERHGAADTRWLRALTAGEATGTSLFLAEYENGEAYGAASDSLNADTELQALLTRLQGPDTPSILTGQSIASEVPLGRAGNPARGTILEIHVSQIVPGRLEQLIDLSAQCADFVEANGASHATLSSISASGSFTNAMSLSWELPDMRAFGRLADTWLADPAGLAIYQTVYGAEAPSTEVFSAIYQVIPI
jgi:hypothetical protein